MIKVMVDNPMFLLVRCDEMRTSDNHNWLFTHVYIIDNSKCVPILLNLYEVDKATFSKLTKKIISSLV
jgi:hypothetical protein